MDILGGHQVLFWARTRVQWEATEQRTRGEPKEYPGLVGTCVLDPDEFFEILKILICCSSREGG